MATLAQLRAISSECGIGMADLAISWPLANPAITCVIAGATKPQQVQCAAVSPLSKPLLLHPERRTAPNHRPLMASPSHLDMRAVSGAVCAARAEVSIVHSDGPRTFLDVACSERPRSEASAPA